MIPPSTTVPGSPAPDVPAAPGTPATEVPAAPGAAPPTGAAPRTGAGALAALVARAESAVRLSGTDPRRGLEEARAVLEEARAVPADARAVPEEAGGASAGEAVSVALRASALAARELGDLELADQRLREAIIAARGLPRRIAQARMSLVTVTALLGDPEGGLRLAGLAERDLTGTDLARLAVQRSVALMLLGRHREAVRHCDEAVGALAGDPRFQAGGLLNRGVARTWLGEFEPAEADLARCAEIARAAGLDHVAMLAEGNLPFVAARRGDVPAAFERYQAAEIALFGFPERLAAMRTDFAEALVAAGLPGEARTLLGQAVPELVAAGAQAAVPGARLLLAQAELLSGDSRLAGATAQTARAELAEQGRTAWLPLAEEVVLRARLAHDRADRASLEALRACADDLAGHGWQTESASLRLTAARAAVRLGERAFARTHLDIVARSATRPVTRHHAVAMRLRLDGDLPGALAAAGAGLDVLACDAGHPADTGSESASRPDTAEPGCGAAPGDAAAPRESAEPDSGVPDSSVAGAALRALAARPAEELAAFGLELAMETGDAWAVLSWAERWRAIVRGARPTAMGFGPAGRAAGPLVELVRQGDALAAVVVAEGRCALRLLGSYQAVAEATVRVRYGLRRRNLQDCGAAGDLEGELAALDRLLLGPLGIPEEGPVAVVPTGALCTLPWPLLPSLRGRPVSVAPAAASWLTDAPQPTSADEPLVVAVAGPGLDHARAEARLVASAHRGGRQAPATRQEVLSALERAEVLHVAAHGMFSPRSPMLSRITLDDGPLMAYDLLKARRAPRLVVLSACDAGMAHAPLDGAALGLAGAFLDRGSACVVAGVVPVRDDEALTLMTLFHALVAEGRSAADALGTAAAKTGVPGFVCFGRGDLPVRSVLGDAA
ncbi:CHAT domain-containing protein [Microbispora sp. NPDC049125]|uniref:CHAT domain-containing protein n=1 Tax=Microbispora sp. NPDC049125 TaxID=3154929 RepID=UPI0034650491